MNIINAIEQELHAVEAGKYEGFTTREIREAGKALRAARALLSISLLEAMDGAEIVRMLTRSKSKAVNIVGRHIAEIL